jgi:SAM-dependent methyltransferase
LQEGAQWDKREFHLTGIRFVDRMMKRIVDYGYVEPSRASILEIGYGVGRFLKPLACRFRLACGVDISEAMLKSAMDY